MSAATALYKDFPLATCYFPLAPKMQFHFFTSKQKSSNSHPFDYAQGSVSAPPHRALRGSPSTSHWASFQLSTIKWVQP